MCEMRQRTLFLTKEQEKEVLGLCRAVVNNSTLARHFQESTLRVLEEIVKDHLEDNSVSADEILAEHVAAE